MPKPFLHNDDAKLETDLIHTLIAGLHEWRPDLHYPESHNDMSGCVRAAMRMFKIERLPLPRKLKIRCYGCQGGGQASKKKDGYNEITTCDECGGRGWNEE